MTEEILPEAPMVHTSLACTSVRASSFGGMRSIASDVTDDPTVLVRNSACTTAVQAKKRREFNVVTSGTTRDGDRIVLSDVPSNIVNTYERGGSVVGQSGVIAAPANGVYRASFFVNTVRSPATAPSLVLGAGQYASVAISDDFCIDAVWKASGHDLFSLDGSPAGSMAGTELRVAVFSARADGVEAPGGGHVTLDCMYASSTTYKLVLNAQDSSGNGLGTHADVIVARDVAYHLAVVWRRKSRVLKLFVDGAEAVSMSVTSRNFGAGNDPAGLGRASAGFRSLPSPLRMWIGASPALTGASQEFRHVRVNDALRDAQVVALKTDPPPADAFENVTFHGGVALALIGAADTGKIWMMENGARVVYENETDFGDSAGVGDAVVLFLKRDDALSLHTDSDIESATFTLALLGNSDLVIPRVALVGSEVVAHELGDAYVDAGVVAEMHHPDGTVVSAVPTAVEGINVDVLSLGSSVITYALTAGDVTASVSRVVNVIGTTPPDLALVGLAVVHHERATYYVDAGATTGSSGLPVSVDNGVDPQVAGTYFVTYAVADASGNEARVTRTVHVVDTTLPKITLSGGVVVGAQYVTTVERLTPWSEPGYVATDDSLDHLDPIDLTASVVVSWSAPPNTSVSGDYSINYNVSDAAGNVAVQATRTVRVVDTTPPVITLSGPASVTIERLSTYVDQGATAADGNVSLTSSIIATSTVNAAVSGTYSVTYNVTDAAGNAAVPKTRTVSVTDTVAPVLTMLGAASVTIESVSDSTFPSAAMTADTTTLADGTYTASASSFYSSSYVPFHAFDGNASTTFATAVLYNFSTGYYTGTTTTTVDGVSVAGEWIQIAMPSIATCTRIDISPLNSGTDRVPRSFVVAAFVNGSWTKVLDKTAVQDWAVGQTKTYSFSSTVASTTYRLIAREIGNKTSGGSNQQHFHIIGIQYHGTGEYADAGAIAIDGDTDLTSSIVATSTVNPSVPGTYYVHYNVADAAGNSALQVTRTVIVNTSVVFFTTNALLKAAVTNYFVNGNTSNYPVLSKWDVSAVTNFGFIFSLNDYYANGKNLNSEDLSSWDLSNATNVNHMFNSNYSFNNSTIQNWNVSNVTTFVSTFRYASSFNQPLNWNVSKGTSFLETFNGSSFNHSSISSWRPSAATNMNHMFNGDTNFNQNLSSWASSVNNVTQFVSMFYNTNFTQDSALWGWNMKSTANVSSMVATAGRTDKTAPTLTLVGSNPATIFAFTTYTDAGVTASDSQAGVLRTELVSNTVNINVAGTYYVTYRAWDKIGNNATIARTVTVIAVTFTTLATLKAAVTNYFGGNSSNYPPLTRWNVSAVTSFQDLFNGNTYYANGKNLNTESLASWNLANATSLHQMFYANTSFNNSTIANWNVSNVATFNRTFMKTSAFNQAVNWNVSKGTNFSETFRESAFNHSSISAWRPTVATTMYAMFYAATAFNQNLSAWASSVNNVTNFSYMFTQSFTQDSTIWGWNMKSTASVDNMVTSSGRTDKTAPVITLNSVFPRDLLLSPPTSNTSVVTSIGTVVVNASIVTGHAFRAFDMLPKTSWQSVNGRAVDIMYNSYSGTHKGSATTVVGGVSVSGQWLEFTSPTTLTAQAVIITPEHNDDWARRRSPREFVIAAKTGSGAWVNTLTMSDVQNWSGGVAQKFDLTTPIAATTFRIIVKRIGNFIDGYYIDGYHGLGEFGIVSSADDISAVSIWQNDTYIDAGATASDSQSGLLRTEVTSNNVNKSVVGTYSVTHRAWDKIGNNSSRTRTVYVDDSYVIQRNLRVQNNSMTVAMPTGFTTIRVTIGSVGIYDSINDLGTISFVKGTTGNNTLRMRGGNGLTFVNGNNTLYLKGSYGTNHLASLTSFYGLTYAWSNITYYDEFLNTWVFEVSAVGITSIVFTHYGTTWHGFKNVTVGVI